MIYQSNKSAIHFFERIVGEVNEINKDVEKPGGEHRIVGYADINDRRGYLRIFKELYWINYEALFNNEEIISIAVKESSGISEVNCHFTFEIERDAKELFSVLINYMVKVAALKGKKCFIIKYAKKGFSGGENEMLIEEVLTEFGFAISNYDYENMMAVKFLEFSHIPRVLDVNLKDIWYGDFLGMDYYVTKENSDGRNYLYKFIMGKLLLWGEVQRPKQNTVAITDLYIKEDNSDYIIRMMEHLMLEYMQQGATVFTVRNQRNYENTLAEAMKRMGFKPEGNFYNKQITIG